MPDNTELKEKFLSYFKELPVQKLAAGFIGRHEDTIADWKKADPEFSDQIEIAKSEWALKHSKRVRSEEWLLERVMKDHFAQRNEVTGKDGKDLPIPILKVETDVHTNNSNDQNKLS